MDLKHVLLLLSVIGHTAVADVENTVLKRLQAADNPLQRRAEPCDELIDACIETEETCQETADLCSTGWVDECSSWTEDCTAMHSECTDGWEDTCEKSEKQCTAGYKDVCTATKKVCSEYLPFPYNSVCIVTDEVCKSTEKQCQGWTDVCISTKTTCMGFKEVCDTTVTLCDSWEPVCEGTVSTVCTVYGETCKATGTVCNVAVNTVQAVLDAIENFGECLENHWNSFVDDPTSAIDTECSDNPLNNVECTVRAKGENVWDGFEAGCTLPTTTLGVQFGSVEGDKNTSVAIIQVGDWPLEVPLLEEEWTSRPLKEFLAIDASTTFTFVNDAALDVDGLNYDLTIPGVEWDFDAGVTLFAKEEHDPCEEDIDECRIVLNKGNTNIFQHSFVVGAIPVVITVTAEIYIGAYPKFEGNALTELRVFFDDNGVTLLHSVELELDDPVNAIEDIQDMVDASALVEEVIEKIRFQVTGELEATASLDLCLGVVLGFSVNGVGTEMDIPVCLTAALEVAASADLSGAELEVGASLTLNALELPFELNVPDLSAVVDTACGFVQAPLDQLSPVTSCVPVVECFENLVDDTCEGISEAVSPLDISVELGAITVFEEYEIWSASVSLSTGGEEDEDEEQADMDGGASALHGCSRYEGFNMASGYSGEPSAHPQTDTLNECEELCLSSPDCAMYTWHSELGDWRHRCVTWTLQEAREHGRVDPASWPTGIYRTSGRCKFWVNVNHGGEKTCKASLLVQTLADSTLEECKNTCEVVAECNYIFHNDEECRMFSDCYGQHEASPEGTTYHLTDSMFDQKAKLTFARTGCPNALVDTSAWQTATWSNERSWLGNLHAEENIFKEMADLCLAVQARQATMEQMTQCCGEGNEKCYPVYCHVQAYWAWDGAYQLAFRQTMPFLWNHHMVENEDLWNQGLNLKDKENDNYSVMHWMDKMSPGGRYYYKMVWPEDPDVYYTWSQTNNPFNQPIAGYIPNHIPYTGKSWGGLEPSGTANAIMDGSVKSSEHFYTIGAYTTFNGGIASYAKSDSDYNYPQQQVELYAFRGYLAYDRGVRLTSHSRVDLGVAADVNECAEMVQAHPQCATTSHAQYADTFHLDHGTGNCACHREGRSEEYETTVDTEWTTTSENVVVYQWK